MKYETVSVRKIRLDDKTFDFYRDDPFGERVSTMPETTVLTQVVLREILEGSQYQLIFGHRQIERLSPEDKVPAVIYSADELPDEECGRVILEYDRATSCQVLTLYEKACVIRGLKVSNYRAARILGVNETLIGKWLRGAEAYDEVTSAGGTVKELSFSHLVALGEVTGKAKDPVAIDDKVSFLAKAVEEDLSVRQFERFLKEKLGLLEESKEETAKKGKKKRQSSEDSDDPSIALKGGASGASEELELFFQNKIQEAGLDDVVKDLTVTGDQVTFSVGPVSLKRLGEVGEFLKNLQVEVASKMAA